MYAHGETKEIKQKGGMIMRTDNEVRKTMRIDVATSAHTAGHKVVKMMSNQKPEKGQEKDKREVATSAEEKM